MHSCRAASIFIHLVRGRRICQPQPSSVTCNDTIRLRRPICFGPIRRRGWGEIGATAHRGMTALGDQRRFNLRTGLTLANEQ